MLFDEVLRRRLTCVFVTAHVKGSKKKHWKGSKKHRVPKKSGRSVEPTPLRFCLALLPSEPREAVICLIGVLGWSGFSTLRFVDGM